MVSLVRALYPFPLHRLLESAQNSIPELRVHSKVKVLLSVLVVDVVVSIGDQVELVENGHGNVITVQD